MGTLMEQELRVYKENPERYTSIIKAISELKTTDKESYLSSKRKLITGKMTEEEYNKNFG